MLWGKKNWPIVAIFFLACFLRFYMISGGSVGFWYDQARDAMLSQEIILNRDLKVQGPSASGSQDIFFHGVLYYYLLAPLYVIGHGSPQFVSYVLAILGSAAVFITYAIGREIFKSKQVGYLAAFLQAVSFLHVETSVWLSNPQLLIITVPMFYLFVWRVFKGSKNLWDFILLGLFCGLTVQAALYEVFLGVMLALVYSAVAVRQKTIFLFRWKDYLAAALAFFVTISSMILAEFIMFKRGILTLESLSSFSGGGLTFLDKFTRTISMFERFLQFALAPRSHQGLMLLLIIPLLYGVWKARKLLQLWLLAYIFAPLLLLVILFKDSSHVLNGVETAVYLGWAAGAVALAKESKIGKYFIAILLVTFVVGNLHQLQVDKSNHSHYFVIQKKAALQDQIALIDEMYALADTNPFSFSASTNPFGINVTWSYLFQWYGTPTYGYSPEFIGPPQAGIYGEGIIPESLTVQPLHFTILEPDTGLKESNLADFLYNQTQWAGTPSAEKHFGSLILQVRDLK